MKKPKLTADQNRDRIKREGTKSARRRFEVSRDLVRKAMDDIAADVKKNGGAYLAGRKISKAEVLERAGKSPSYLNKKEPPDLVALAGDVDEFVERMTSGVPTDIHAVHRKVADRARAAEAELDLVRQAYSETELDLSAAHTELRNAEKTIAELQAQNTSLLKQIAGKTVVDLPRRK
jgi:hypothetical protein